MSRPGKRIRLGTWTTPSGNNCVGYYRGGALSIEWDTPPPLLADDEIYYRAVIRPAVIRAVAEYLEVPDRHLVIEP